MSAAVKVEFTGREARVTLDALERLSAYTRAEMYERYGWGKADCDAWSEALGKVDRALTGASA